MILNEKNSSINTRYLIGVAAGKGGVGKSTLAVNLALAWKEAGLKVGLIDADLYGPSIGQMLPEAALPQAHPEQESDVLPASSCGLELMSMAYLRRDGEAAVVRAPIANQLISQFLHRVAWGSPDLLLVDFPPGTGDIQLTLLQQGAFSGALIVTTPQEVALLDVRKTLEMFDQLQVPVLGIIENMSYFLDSQGNKQFLFGEGGGRRLAEECGLPFWGEIPIDPLLCRSGDKGQSIFEAAPEAPAAQAIREIARQVYGYLEGQDVQLSIRNLEQRDSRTLAIQWLDGKIDVFRASELQKRCPCMRCRGNPVKKVDEEVEAGRVAMLGRYALKIEFTSGCSRGIYPFALLKSEVPA